MKTYLVRVSTPNMTPVCYGREQASSDGVAMKRFVKWASSKGLLPNLRKGEMLVYTIARET